MENKTWELVKLPKGRETVGCKWRRVAQGFSQKFGIDYDEIFSSIARFSTICTLLAYAVERKMQVHQTDVVSAFLNGELREEIYMQQPPGYIHLVRRS